MRILSQTEVSQWPDACIIIASLAGALFVSMIIVCALAENYANGVKPWMIFWCGTSAVMLLISTFKGIELYDLHHIDYKVLISEDYSVKEFFDKYELLSIEGEIYEIREYISEERIDEAQGD